MTTDTSNDFLEARNAVSRPIRHIGKSILIGGHQPLTIRTVNCNGRENGSHCCDFVVVDHSTEWKKECKVDPVEKREHERSKPTNIRYLIQVT